MLAAVFAAASATMSVLPASAGGIGIIDTPVSFSVVNNNTSGLPCLTDGAAYTVRGHLVEPRAKAPGARSVTLYLHGLDAGEWFWHLQGVTGYDYVSEMARLGQASVVIDRIGYGGSGLPQGLSSCLGGQASVAHQIIGQLRAGGYAVGSSPDGGPSFNHVVLAGHSIGGAIAQIEAYSYKDIDGLVVLLWADLGATPTSLTDFAQAGLTCALGGQNAKPGGPGGYAFLVPSPSQFQGQLLFDSPPEVVSAAMPLQNRNPCGDFASTATAIAIDELRVREISVPVLLVYGDHDNLFSAQMSTTGLTAQQNLYAGTHDLTETVLGNTGHFMTLERSQPTLRADVQGWLCARGFFIQGALC